MVPPRVLHGPVRGDGFRAVRYSKYAVNGKDMKKTVMLLYAMTSICLSVAGESLWDAEFQGYHRKPLLLREGETVFITLDSDTSLSFSASKTGDKEIVFEFSGGEGSNPFAFLPDVKTGTAGTIEGEEEYSLKGRVAARIGEQRGPGVYSVQGTRSIQLQGAVQALTVTGLLDASLLGEGKTVAFNSLQEGRVVFRSFLETETPLLTEADITRGLAESGTVEAEEGGFGEDAVVEPGDGTGGQIPPEGFSLLEDKKRALLLRFVNQFLDLVFQEE